LKATSQRPRLSHVMALFSFQVSLIRSIYDLSTLLLEGLLVLGLDILDTTNHVEGRLGDRVVLTVKDLLESVEGLQVSNLHHPQPTHDSPP
jgi:hypothetical protein